MKTHIAQTQPAFLGGRWIPIATHNEPRSFEQAFSDVAQALTIDQSQNHSPKRIVRVDDAEEKVVWESQPTNQAKPVQALKASGSVKVADSTSNAPQGKLEAKA